MSIQLLEQIGLSKEESSIYECLITIGSLPARKIAIETGINRSLIYKIIKQLIEQGLVIENENKRGVTTFTAVHPSKLHQIIKRKEAELKLADQSYHEIVSVLGAQFNLTCGKPSVHFYEGIEGIKYLYKDILQTKKNIQLIRSPKDNDIQELQNLVTEQIEKQVEKGIHTRVIAPMAHPHDTFIKNKDIENLVDRCRVPLNELNIPAQIIIYGNKVALTSFDSCIVTTIIENIGIVETFQIIFESLWGKYKNIV